MSLALSQKISFRPGSWKLFLQDNRSSLTNFACFNLPPEVLHESIVPASLYFIMSDILIEIDNTIVHLGKKSSSGVNFSQTEEEQWRGIQQLFGLDHDATLVLGVILANPRESRGYSEDELKEKTAQSLKPVNVRSATQNLLKMGYLVRGDEEREDSSLYISAALEGFLKTRQPHYLAICRTAEQHELLGIAIGWYKQERGHFMFESMHGQMFKSLIDCCDDPLARLLRRLSENVYEQMAVLATAGYSLAQQKPMDLSDLAADIFPNPVEQMLMSGAWSDPGHNLYTQNLLCPAQIVDGRIRQIRLHPRVETKIIPSALRKSLAQKAPGSSFFEIIDYKSIRALPLLYPQSFQEQRQGLDELLKEEKLQAYFRRLSGKGMVPSLQVMLSGPAGTGKTELVRQMARQSRRNLLFVRLEETRDKYFGENEKHIARLFADLHATSRSMSRPPIILFNEADSFFYSRTSRDHNLQNLENSIVTQFLNELERFEGILFATTNYTDAMDKAFDRRWAFKLTVPTPDAQVRKLLITRMLKGYASPGELHAIALRHSFTPAQLNNVFRKLLLHDPRQCNKELIERLVLQELSGWARGRAQVGY